MKKKKTVVRNAERPQTPVHEPPPAEDEVHRAATFLQSLLRGRAIQNDMMEAAAAREALLTELLHPLRTDLSVGVTFTPQEARVANMVAASIRPLLMCAAKLTEIFFRLLVNTGYKAMVSSMQSTCH
jgi:hypothetical protein